MLSIIVTCSNLLGMNRLFYEWLTKNTRLEYELIVIDNDSTDGSREFFRDRADVIIENNANYSYPYSQNQGIDAAKYDYLVFVNNDVLLTEGWDSRIVDVMESQSIEAISPCSNDRLETMAAQKKLNRRWKRIKYPLRFLFGIGYRSLRMMVRLTYGNLDRFAKKRYVEFGNKCVEGFSGSCIVLKRSILDKTGRWDERIQAGDWDYYSMVKDRSLKVGDVKPIQTALGVYVHHFQRLTLRSKHAPFADAGNLISLEDKWGGRFKELTRELEY